jgi:hypothetical protein
MSPQSEETKKQWGITGVAIPGGLLLGMGVGFLSIWQRIATKSQPYLYQNLHLLLVK